MSELDRTVHDALARWKADDAREWPRAIVTADHVLHALRHRAIDSGRPITEEQLLADAVVIADWLHEARTEGLTMPDTTTTAQRIYDLIDQNPRSEYGVVFATMRAVMEPAAYRDGLEGAYRYALAQFDGEEWTVAGVLREELERNGWEVNSSNTSNSSNGLHRNGGAS